MQLYVLQVKILLALIVTLDLQLPCQTMFIQPFLQKHQHESLSQCIMSGSPIFFTFLPHLV